jgi:hypothetical protein
MNVLFCIGCDQYEFIAPLKGAECDAREMFAALNYQGYYDATKSRLLLSPTAGELTAALAECFRNGRAGIFTFFFAGHSGSKNGAFFMALRDSETDALSTTAFPTSRLFEMINEFQPGQVNIILDGCESGSSSSNIHTLLGSEHVGSIRASSISFLGACAAGQYAGESSEGGLLTRNILRVLRGQGGLLLTKQCIELTDIAAHVSEIVSKESPSQRPTWWGLNLFGRGGLALNPIVHIESPLPSLSLTTIATDSPLAYRLTELSGELWDEYRLVNRDFDASRLNHLLCRILSAPEASSDDRLAVILGLTKSFSSVAEAEGEMFAQLLCSAACLTPLLPWIDDQAVRAAVRRHLEAEFNATNDLLAKLSVEMRAEDGRLLSPNGFLSDIYYLPLRVTRLLGLLGALALINRMFAIESEATLLFYKEMVTMIITKHSKLLVALDDEQAAPLYVFLKAAQQFGWMNEGREIVQSFYVDAANRSGQFNRVNSGGREAFNYVLATTDSKLAPSRVAMANPSSLLAVILLGGVWFECDEDWDLRAFDRRHLGLFFPDDFRHFSELSISSGYTHTWHIGFGIWKTREIMTAFREILSSRGRDAELPPEAHALCILMALLFPNRVPLNLESVRGSGETWQGSKA